MSLKPIIKSAREALDRKDYPYALQLCTDALAFEPDNFWLLLFRAVALGNTGQVEEALKEYQKAARAQSDNPTAFQGIVTLFESKGLEIDDRYHSALESLCSILFKQKEFEKHMALMRKRLNLFKEAKNVPECLKLLNWFTSPEAKDFYPPALLPNQISILKEQFDLMAPIESAQIAKDIENGRMRLAAADPLDRLTDRCHVQNYSKEFTQIIRQLRLTASESDAYTEMLINRLNRIVLSDFCVNEELRKEYALELKELIANCDSDISCHIKYNLDTEGIISKPMGSFPSGPRNIMDSLEYSSDYNTILKLFDELESVCKRWHRAFNIEGYSKFIQKARKLKLKALISLSYNEDALELSGQFQDQDLLDDLLFEPILSVLESFGNLSRAITLIEAKLMQIDPEHPGIILRLVEDLIEAKRFDEAKEYLEAIKEAYSLDNLESVTQARISFATGLCSWTANPNKSDTLAHFLTAAKLNPSESKYFTWIGKFYWRVERDTERAKKCFIKALNLDSSNFPAALLLSEVLLLSERDSGIASEVCNLLKPFTKQSCHSRNRKLFYFYGVSLFYSGDFLNSSVAFQSALKSSSDTEAPVIEDENCLQWLGEAYLRSNRLGSAAKTFTRLASTSIYGKVGLATVHLKSNNPIEAVDVLDSIPVDKKISKISLDKSEALISLARFYLRQGRFISAMKSLLRSLGTLKDVSEPSAYRLAAECFILAHSYRSILGFPLEEFKKYGNLEFKVNPGLSAISDALESSNSELLIIGTKFALTAISEAFTAELSSDVMAVYWLQLAVCLSKFEGSDELREFAISAAETALKSEHLSLSTAAQCHHILASIYCTSNAYRVAQHHFISALKAKESPMIWTDLGRFYLKAGDWELAGESFKRALALDPEDLMAAFELAKCGGSLEGQEAARQVAQRAFSTQPVLFSEEFASTLAAHDNPLKEIAGVYLHRLHGSEKVSTVDYSWMSPDVPDIPEFDTKADLLAYLNEKSNECPRVWLSPQSQIFDCEFLLKRPENELAQSGWRAVVEGLLPSTKERTAFELGELAIK